MKKEEMNRIYGLTQQLQIFDAQKQSIIGEKNEINEALKELKPDEECYKLVGSVLIKKTYKELKEELDERLKEINENIEAINSHEKKIQEEIKELQKDFQSNAA